MVPHTDTPANLGALVERARAHRMSPQERFDQRVSFVWGQMAGGHDAPTKAWVRDRLAGRDVA